MFSLVVQAKSFSLNDSLLSHLCPVHQIWFSFQICPFQHLSIPPSSPVATPMRSMLLFIGFLNQTSHWLLAETLWKDKSIMTPLLHILQWCPSWPIKTQESLERHLASRNPVFFYYLLPSIHTPLMLPQRQWPCCWFSNTLGPLYQAFPPWYV